MRDKDKGRAAADGARNDGGPKGGSDAELIIRWTALGTRREDMLAPAPKASLGRGTGSQRRSGGDVTVRMAGLYAPKRPGEIDQPPLHHHFESGVVGTRPNRLVGPGAIPHPRPLAHSQAKSPRPGTGSVPHSSQSPLSERIATDAFHHPSPLKDVARSEKAGTRQGGFENTPAIGSSGTGSYGIQIRKSEDHPPLPLCELESIR